jgi:hypothetical protein
MTLPPPPHTQYTHTCTHTLFCIPPLPTQLKLRPSQLFTDFRAKSLVGPTLELEERQVEKMHAAAEAFNEASRRRRPAVASVTD